MSEFESRDAFLSDLEEDDNIKGEPEKPKNNKKKMKRTRSSGLTPSQLFILAAMLFFLILIVGFLVMLVTGKMVF